MIDPRAKAAHDLANAAGKDGYLDPKTGYFVMTSGYLQRRAHCCGKGCRHCPWPQEEQRRAGRAILSNPPST
jgi:hypothetical protein